MTISALLVARDGQEASRATTDVSAVDGRRRQTLRHAGGHDRQPEIRALLRPLQAHHYK